MVEIVKKEDICKFIHNMLKNSYTIVCIGTYLRSDDRVALELCNTINIHNITTISCEHGLENCIHEIIEKKLSKLAIFDAAIIEGAELDGIAILSLDELEDTHGVSLSSHSIPMNTIVRYLKDELNNVDILFIAIPVKNLDIGLEMSPEVKSLLEDVVKCFTYN
ncbi:MAG: hydrogenase maturation protease [Ignisphaera sp.]|uniref:Hydrogenase maturation protease n=1 Tax=Ignisphaera aggregans TaxID=334771 RepID=A0A7J3MYD6_9CREN